MPNTPSAIKRLAQSKKRRLRNRVAKKIIKTYTKRCLTAAAEGKFEQAEADFRVAFSKLSKAGVRRVLHPNTADHRKSKLACDYHAAVAQAKAKAEKAAKAASAEEN